MGARSFDVWEGGGEYNVARGLRRCFGMRAGILTALVDNPVGRLVEDLMLQGGVDQSRRAVGAVRWGGAGGSERDLFSGAGVWGAGWDGDDGSGGDGGLADAGGRCGLGCGGLRVG